MIRHTGKLVWEASVSTCGGLFASLLNQLNENPNDLDLAAKYFLSHQTDQYLFSSDLNKQGNIKDSYYSDSIVGCD